MSAPPFFQSVGRGEGGKEGPTVVIWESPSEQEKENWLEEGRTKILEPPIHLDPATNF